MILSWILEADDGIESWWSADGSYAAFFPCGVGTAPVTAVARSALSAMSALSGGGRISKSPWIWEVER